MFKKIAALTLAVCLAQAAPAAAGGLRTTFGEVLVDDLPPGEAYSLEADTGLPLVITNTSDQEVELKLELLAPAEGELKEGYEAIPDLGWITLSETEFTVPPGEDATSDITIDVPYDEDYAGGKYQVFIWSHTVGRSIGVGLKSKLLFSVREGE